jgi:hypothetical protein
MQVLGLPFVQLWQALMYHWTLLDFFAVHILCSDLQSKKLRALAYYWQLIFSGCMIVWFIS